MIRLLEFIFWNIIGVSSLFAAGDSNDPNDPTSKAYLINLSDMDPIRKGVTVGGVGGKSSLLIILQNFSEILLFTVPIIAAISVIVAGYYYVFSTGDTEKANRGKTIIKWNIVAILVAFMSWSLIQLIASLLT